MNKFNYLDDNIKTFTYDYVDLWRNDQVNYLLFKTNDKIQKIIKTCNYTSCYEHYEVRKNWLVPITDFDTKFRSEYHKSKLALFYPPLMVDVTIHYDTERKPIKSREWDWIYKTLTYQSI